VSEGIEQVFEVQAAAVEGGPSPPMLSAVTDTVAHRNSLRGGVADSVHG